MIPLNSILIITLDHVVESELCKLAGRNSRPLYYDELECITQQRDKDAEDLGPGTYPTPTSIPYTINGYSIYTTPSIHPFQFDMLNYFADVIIMTACSIPGNTSYPEIYDFKFISLCELLSENAPPVTTKKIRIANNVSKMFLSGFFDIWNDEFVNNVRYIEDAIARNNSKYILDSQLEYHNCVIMDGVLRMILPKVKNNTMALNLIIHIAILAGHKIERTDIIKLKKNSDTGILYIGRKL